MNSTRRPNLQLSLGHLQKRPENDGSSRQGAVSCSHLEQLVDELHLLPNIRTAHPPRLPLPDHVHCLVSLDRSQDLANQKLAILEFSQKRRFTVDEFIEARISSRKSPLERRIEEMLSRRVSQWRDLLHLAGSEDVSESLRQFPAGGNQ